LPLDEEQAAVKSEIPLGAHLVSPRTGYTHHGIYVGDGQVVHYSGLADGNTSGPVELTTLEKFSNGQGIEVKTYMDSIPPEEIVARAKSRIGEASYSVFNNNCEHFCHWCILGDHTSPQVDSVTWLSARTLAQLIGLGGTAIVAAAGPVAGLSGAGIMSGLAATGAVVGSGAVAGVALLGGVPGAATAHLLNSTVLADNPTLEKPEKSARSFGRKAAYTGAVTGTAGSIATIGAAGSVAGFSGPGIMTGLAAIGGAVGGTAGAGVFVALAAPAAIAAGLGYGAYKLRRSFSKSPSKPKKRQDKGA
jgi:hypothetical protein